MLLVLSSRWGPCWRHMNPAEIAQLNSTQAGGAETALSGRNLALASSGSETTINRLQTCNPVALLICVERLAKLSTGGEKQLLGPPLTYPGLTGELGAECAVDGRQRDGC